GLSAGPWITEADGTATAELTSTKAGTVTVTAYLGADSTGDVIGEVAVTFTPGAISVGVNGTEISGAGLTRVADGNEAATITVQLKDENGNDIAQSGVAVTFATTLGDLSTTDPVNTGANGQA